MKRRTRFLGLMVLLMTVAMTGCASWHQTYEPLGGSLAALKEAMVANPDAGQDGKPIEGLSSTTAAAVIRLYHRGQIEQSVQQSTGALEGR